MRPPAWPVNIPVNHVGLAPNTWVCSVKTVSPHAQHHPAHTEWPSMSWGCGTEEELLWERPNVGLQGLAYEVAGRAEGEGRT